MTTVVLVPAYEPDTKLHGLVASLRTARPGDRVVIVDDGSGPKYHHVFAGATEFGAEVITHERNRGKGAALKTGFAHITAHYPGADVVCADCDGQHTAPDIGRVAAALRHSPHAMVLGVRDFAGRVPAKSRLGNGLTRLLFTSATGSRLRDTQTGLRGYPASTLPWLCSVPGDRFEYELAVLLAATAAGYAIVEVPTSTIYLEGNASSHFRPIIDSARVYAPLIRFGASSIFAFFLDAIALFGLVALTDNLFFAVVVARGLSAAVNFATNRRHVFRAHGHTSFRSAAVRYGLLALIVLLCNYGLMRILIIDLGVSIVIAKLVTELGLFTFSYQAQRRWIFLDRAEAGTKRPTPARTV
jgi:glycosyltransferase involved in cell wall biosynthesis